LQQFDTISVKGFMISYGGDCVDLSAIMNIMNHANPNCRLTKYDISAVRLSSHQLAYSALHGLHGKEFHLATAAESISLVQRVADAVGTASYKITAQSCGAKGHNIFYEGVQGPPHGPVPADPDATIPQMFRQGDSHKLRIHAHNCLELALLKWKSREFYSSMVVEHKIRTTWRGGGQIPLISCEDLYWWLGVRVEQVSDQPFNQLHQEFPAAGF